MNVYRMPTRVLPDDRKEIMAFSLLLKTPPKQKWAWLPWCFTGAVTTFFLTSAVLELANPSGRSSDAAALWVSLVLGLALVGAMVSTARRLYRGRRLASEENRERLRVVEDASTEHDAFAMTSELQLRTR